MNLIQAFGFHIIYAVKYSGICSIKCQLVLFPLFQPDGAHIAKILGLFLLVHIFQIISYRPLIEQLLSLLLFGDADDITSVAGVSLPPPTLQVCRRLSLILEWCF